MIFVKQNVCWFQVLMHDALLMQVRKCLSDLANDAPHILDIDFSFHGHFIQILLQITSFHQLHKDVELLLFVSMLLAVLPNEILIVYYAGVVQGASDTELFVHLLKHTTAYLQVAENFFLLIHTHLAITIFCF
jgi:hypothetical protein